MMPVPIRFFHLLLACLLLATLASCVGKKKWQAAQYLVEQGERRERQLRAQLEYADRQMRYLTERNGDLDQVIGALRREKARLEADTTTLGRRLRASSNRSRMTQEELGAELTRCQAELEETSASLTRIREAVQQRDNRLQAAFVMLRDSLNALPSAQPAELTFQNGRITLSLPDQLVFGTSNLRVTPEGNEVLQRTATVFNRFPDLEVMVLGHTSTQQAPRGYYDNWGFSVRRAAAAVRLMTEAFDVSANQLTAAGKGEYLPRQSNATPEGQAANRRLEFVLSPRLDLLYRNILQEGS